MKRLKVALLTMPILLTMSCSDKTAELKTYADRACECKDAECGTKLMGEFMEWAKENKGATGDQKKAEEYGERLATCLLESGVDPEVLLNAFNSFQ